MNTFHQYVRGIILIGFSMLVFKLLLTGNIYNFIAPKMHVFMYGTLGTVLLLGILQVWRSADANAGCGCCHQKPRGGSGLYVLFVLPIVTGFLFADASLDSSIAAKRGVALAGSNGEVAEASGFPLGSESVPEHTEELKRKLLQARSVIVDSISYIETMDIIGGDVEAFRGKTITFTGFVHHEEDFPPNQAIIARYGVTCCAADTSVLGMLVSGEEIGQLKAGEWVEVTGRLDSTMYIDTRLPIVHVQKLRHVKQPKVPYVYRNLQNMQE